MIMYVDIFLYVLFMFTAFVLVGFAAFKFKVFSKQEFKMFVKIAAISCGIAAIIVSLIYFLVSLSIK